MLTIRYDLRYLQAGLEQLEPYLLSRDLYRPLGIQSAHHEPPYPQLTPAWLLLAQKRAQANAQTQPERDEVQRLSQQLEALQTRWRSAWGLKAQAEFRARLNLWRDFLEEYRQSPAENDDRYAYEVNRRVLLELLLPEASPLADAQLQALGGLDLWLQAILVPGPFIWEVSLIPGFPQATFWYLYGTMPKSTP